MFIHHTPDPVSVFLFRRQTEANALLPENYHATFTEFLPFSFTFPTPATRPLLLRFSSTERVKVEPRNCWKSRPREL